MPKINLKKPTEENPQQNTKPKCKMSGAREGKLGVSGDMADR